MNKKTEKKLDKLKKDGMKIIGKMVEEDDFNNMDLFKKLSSIIDEHQNLVYDAFKNIDIELKED